MAFYKEDLWNAETMSDIVKRERIDTCVHLAAKVSVADSVKNPVETTSVNVMGTFSMLEACAANHADKFILASSAAVYGNPAQVPESEDHALTPLAPYRASKVAAEALAASYQSLGKIKSAISFRFFNVYGPGEGSQYSGVITKIAQKLSEGLPPIIYGDGRQTRDFISVDDAIMLAAKTGFWGFQHRHRQASEREQARRQNDRARRPESKAVPPRSKRRRHPTQLRGRAQGKKVLGFSAKEDLNVGFMTKR